MSTVENVAERLLLDLGVRSPSDLRIEDIAWLRNALVSYEPLERASARLIIRGNFSVITVSTSLSNRGQQRFAAAHELGHLEIHRALNDLNLCLDEDIDPRPGLGPQPNPTDGESLTAEQEASRFAGALLMPNFLFEPLLHKQPPTMKLIADLAHTFGTSLTATAIRYARLQKEPVAIVWSQQKRIRWYQPSRTFDYHVRVGDELDKYTIAIDFFEGRDLPSRPTSVDASSWLAAGRFDPDGIIQEDSFAISSYQSVLTLLWVNKDIEREYDPSERVDRRER